MGDSYTVIKWPVGRWKGYDLRKVPVSHLNWILKQEYYFQKNNIPEWHDLIIKELQRRHCYQVRNSFTEHFWERLTSQWPRLLLHYRGLVDKNAGVVTVARRLFARALSEGITIPDKDDKDGTKFIVIDKDKRWVYMRYSSEDTENMKAITIFKLKKDGTF